MKKLIGLILLLVSLFGYAQPKIIPDVNSSTFNFGLQYLDMRWFGIGTTNDSISWVRAFAKGVSLGRNIYYIPSNTTITSGTISAPAGTSIIGGDRSTSILIQRSTGGTLGNLINSNGNLTIKNLTLDGNHANISGTLNSLVSSVFFDGLTFDQVTFKNSQNYAIQAIGTNTISLKNSSADTIGAHVLYCYNSSNVLVEDVNVLGWDYHNGAQSAFALTGNVINRYSTLNRVTTENKFSCSNFSVETGGASAQLMYMRVTNCNFNSSYNGSGGSGGSGSGVSLSIDSSYIGGNFINNRLKFNLGIECSGSADTYENNTLFNAIAAIGTNLGDTAKDDWFIHNRFAGNDPTPQNFFLTTGGYASSNTAKRGVLDNLLISENTFDGRGIVVYHDIILAFYGAIRGYVRNARIDHNTGYGSGTSIHVQFSGYTGSNIFITRSTLRGYQYVAIRDSGSYTTTFFKDNFAPGAAVAGTGINGTNYPNFQTSGNVVDTTQNGFEVNGVIISSGSGFANPMTAANDLIIGGTSGTPTRLAVGTGFLKSTAPLSYALPAISTDISGLGTNIATWLGSPTSANLAAALTDETGTGALVFATSPTLITPVLGAATATSINKITFTAPATSATFSPVTGSTLATIGAFSLTLTATATTNATFPAGTGTLAYLAGTNSWTGKNTFTGIANGYVAKTAAYTLTTTDYMVNFTTAGVTATLPTAVGATGQLYVIKNSASSGVITIATTSAQTIDGASTFLLSSQYDCITLQSNGANWVVVVKNLSVGTVGLVYSNSTVGLFGSANTYTFTYTTVSDGTAHMYAVNANFQITTTGGTLTCTAGYTDQNSHTRTTSYFPMGATSAAASAAGSTNFGAAAPVFIASNTVVTYTVVTTGVLVADGALSILKLN